MFRFLVLLKATKLRHPCVLWILAFFFLFLIGSLSLFIDDYHQHERHRHEEARKKLQTQFDHVASLLTLIDKRLLQAKTDHMRQKILQDPYSTFIAGEAYPKILNVYHIDILIQLEDAENLRQKGAL